MVLRYVRTVRDTVRGEIKSSLYESLLQLGEKPGLIADYTDIFGWEIDFFSETQPGDSFFILFQRRIADTAFIGYGAVLAERYKGQVGDFRGFRFSDPDGRADYYNSEGQCLRKTFLKSPLRFSRISSFFGNRFHPIRRIVCPHQGIDYAAPVGTPVCCVADGRVSSAGWTSGYGRLVEVSHADGFVTRYGHLSGFGKGIKTGERIVQGQVIGYVGSTGMSTGPHLHYEVRKFGTPTNPLRLNPPRHEPVKQIYLSAFHALADSLQLALVQPGPQPQPGPAPH
jgi:murein DD-endopeptidase MepM/ murein hydrolase activator NlpD